MSSHAEPSPQDPEALAAACAELHAHGPVPLPQLNPNVWAGKTVVFAGGGTAGHLMPGLAILELWKEVLPEPPQVHWIGSPNRIEATLIPERGIPFHPLDITYFRRSLSPQATRQNLSVAWRLATGRTFRDAEVILRRVGAELVISLGSFVGGPVVVAAHHAAIPSVLMAMDAVIGRGHRWSAPVADAICASTEAGMEQLARYKGKIYLTGTPVRPSLFRGDAVAARFEFGITAKRPTLLVVGGSQGARAINNVVPALWQALNGPEGPGLNILHQAGEAGAKETVPPAGSGGSYAVRPFIANMANAYALADLVLCRAGANTLAEVAALGKPSILVPFAESAEGHQLANARAMAEQGMAICVTEDELSAGRLAGVI
ncbi:MAG TPA: UDP-N-acetylglucosamine--N-acetylmuramyl-(pentapeptide) pyrophosphoryl-undecaprenol N-acetylglucosamine transferase, partial [bacterium]|nr:UDP-N-acetylglucosamine--N-acetylmuramyl-(pentapeptide) pyrophosphoryl-undecaprenol N-acetylglucosamine transferase [bacterium]